MIVDAAPPPSGPEVFNAHASTLAFELTSGRRPLIVNCGSGRSFGADWRRAGRATPSHSTLAVAGRSSARLGPTDSASGRERLIDGPTHVPVELNRAASGWQFQGAHDGFVRSYGLTHSRILELTLDGRDLSGEDMLLALEDAQKKTFDQIRASLKGQRVPFDIRFHLHPDVDAVIIEDSSSVLMKLKSGEEWIFRHEGHQLLRLAPSVYLEAGRLEPRASNQIVLSGHAVSYATRVRWSLFKSPQTATAVRDFRQDALEPI